MDTAGEEPRTAAHADASAPSDPHAWKETWQALLSQASEAEAEVLHATAQLGDLVSSVRGQAAGDIAGQTLPAWGVLQALRARVRSARERDINGCPKGLRTQLRLLRTELQAQAESLSLEEQQLSQALHAAVMRCERCPPAASPPSSTKDAQLGEGTEAASIAAETECPNGGGGASGQGLKLEESSTTRSRRCSSTAPALIAGKGPDEDDEIQSLRAAIAELEARVREAGGERGGWPFVDHAIFVRVARPLSAQIPEVVLQALCSRLPHIERSCHETHLNWFLQHDALQREKRHLLARWRSRLADLARQARDADVANFEEQQRRSEERRRSRSAEQHRRIAYWRRERALGERIAAASLRRVEIDQALLDDERRSKERLQHEATKRAIQEHEATKRALETVAPKASPTTVSTEEKRRISRRNLELLRRKHEACSAVRSRPGSASTMPHRSRKYDHVGSRLLCATESSALRVATRGLEPLEEPEPSRPPQQRLARPVSAPHTRASEHHTPGAPGAEASPSSDEVCAMPADGGGRDGRSPGGGLGNRVAVGSGASAVACLGQARGQVGRRCGHAPRSGMPSTGGSSPPRGYQSPGGRARGPFAESATASPRGGAATDVSSSDCRGNEAGECSMRGSPGAPAEIEVWSLAD